MTTRCIMLIRHAEKPHGPDGRTHGVNAAGAPDAGSLSVKGWQRAGALIPYFTSMADYLQERRICHPRHIFAARPTGQHPSTRPTDTVSPLADRTAIPIDESWSASDAPGEFASQLRAFDVPVLVCWRHDELPALAQAILQRDAAPAQWPEDRFDMTWVIRDDGSGGSGGSGWTFVQTPQLLLAGDQARVIG